MFFSVEKHIYHVPGELRANTSVVTNLNPAYGNPNRIKRGKYKRNLLKCSAKSLVIISDTTSQLNFFHYCLGENGCDTLMNSYTVDGTIYTYDNPAYGEINDTNTYMYETVC